jgi:prevent-host-death family protein
MPRSTIDITQDIQSLTSFKRDSNRLVKRIRRTGRPLVITLKGKAEVVILDAGVYQRLADQSSAIEGIRRGLAQAKKGLGRDADVFFDELESAARSGR